MATQKGFFASASQLEMHKSINRQQIHLASELVRAIDGLRALEGFQADERYRLLEKKAKKSLGFLESMSSFLDEFQESVVETSQQARKMLAETRDTNARLLRRR